MTYPKLWPVGGHPVGEAKVRQLNKLGPKWLRASGQGWVAEKQGALSNVKYGAGGGLVAVSPSFEIGTAFPGRVYDPTGIRVWASDRLYGRMDYRQGLNIQVAPEAGAAFAVIPTGDGRLFSLESTSELGDKERVTRNFRAWGTKDFFGTPPSSPAYTMNLDGRPAVLYSVGKVLRKFARVSGGWSETNVPQPIDETTQTVYQRPVRIIIFSLRIWVVYGSSAGEGAVAAPQFYRTTDAGVTWTAVPNTDALFYAEDFNNPLDGDDFPVERTIVQVEPITSKKAVVVVENRTGSPSTNRIRATVFDFSDGTIIRQNAYDSTHTNALGVGGGVEVMAVTGDGGFVVRKWRYENLAGLDHYWPEYVFTPDFFTTEYSITRNPSEKDTYNGDDSLPNGPNIMPFSAWYKAGYWLYLLMDGRRRELWSVPMSDRSAHRRLAVLSEPTPGNENGFQYAYDWMFSEPGFYWLREFTRVWRIGAPDAIVPVGNGYPWQYDSRFAPPQWWVES